MVLLLVLCLFVVGFAGCAEDSGDAREEAREQATSATSASPKEEGNANGVAAAGGTVNDSGALGSAGDELLSPGIPSAVIEIDRSPRATLAADPVAVIGEELREHGAKEHRKSPHSSAVPAQPVYTANDLRALVAEHRGSVTTSDTVAVYILVLEGRYENERATGVAFAATSAAIFPDQISGGLAGLNRSAYEEAVLVHELGHLFGLVDLTGLGDFHEDPQHPGHSQYESSVMYWAIEDVSIRNVFRGGPPREFDAADRREMARIRAG